MADCIGKVALVTGTANERGFGRAIAVALAKEGADVVVTDKSLMLPYPEGSAADWKGLESIAKEIEALGMRSLVINCDTTQSREVDTMVEEASKTLGEIDLLVCNAGVLARGTIDVITDEIWNANISVNLTGTFFCCRAVAKKMIKRGKGGKIINISSQLGKYGIGEGHIGYCASKFGIIGLTQTLALELARYGITVNSVCPGMADTDIQNEFYGHEARRLGVGKDELTAELFAKRLPDIPLGRLTMPKDVADMVTFLASKKADYITGQSLNVNGGRFMAH